MQAWQATVQDDFGNANPNPVVSVYQADGTTLATVYNEAGATLANPVAGNVDGFVQFYAPAGRYKIDSGSEVWEWANLSNPPLVAEYDTLSDAVSQNQGGSVRVDYNATTLPSDYSGVLLEYTKAATAQNIGLSGFGTGVGMRTLRTQFPESHDGSQYHALNIEAVSRGSGVNGPTAVENGLTINVAKRGFAGSSPRGGAFNCMYLYGRQDGPKGLPAGHPGSSDIGGIIANLSIVEDAGFLCIGEATSTQIQGTSPFSQLLQLQTQYGVINGNAAGGAKSYGWLAISKVGVNTAAYYAASEGSSSWDSLFLSPNKVKIDANGDYRSLQTSWSDGAINIERDKTSVNGNSTIRHRGTGSLRILAQENANISLGTNNTIHIRLGGDGNLVPNSAGGSNLGQPSLRFGGAYIGALDASGAVSLGALPIFEDNAAALAGGLIAGRVYRTAAGSMRVVI